jgi:hypothetical protein
MKRSSQMTASSVESASVRSMNMEGDGRVAMIEVDLTDSDGNITARGDVVCLWRAASFSGSDAVREAATDIKARR